MRKWIVIVVAAAALSACSKSSNSQPAESPSQASTGGVSSAKANDAVQQKLQELAGASATDCGRIASQASSDVQPASDCAMKAVQEKKAFYVAYELPGLTTAVAGNAEGKLFAVQSQGSGQAESTPCPSALRIAQSGRVTCYAPGSMGGMPAGMSPHGDASGAANPHASGAVPSHGSNPHAKTSPH